MSEIGGRLSAGTPEDQQPIKLPPEFEQHAGVRPDEDTARWLRRHLPSGVAVVTAVNDGIYYGVTVSAFSYVSLDPLLVFVALGNESQTSEQIQVTGTFGVSLLTNTHRFLADRFAGRAPAVDRRFADVPHVVAETGSPLLADCIAWLDCAVESHYTGGDHVIYIGGALSVGHGTGDETDPLIYFDSSYKRIR
jgi:flavin reductase (DIM6/NTAB) family NADH-FMN oxidoreductase RutF